MAKIANARSLLLRSARDRTKNQLDHLSKIEQAIRQMKAILPELEKADSLDRIRGIEGIAAQYYFSVFDHLVLVEESEFRFRGRKKRPPLDNLNALLSFLYTMLAHDAVSACEAIGLDPQMGFFHADRPGRNSLALDLMEEFRPMIDRFVLSLVNRRQVKPDGFQRRESGEIRMDENTRKTVLMAYQNRKKEEILHPFLKEKVPVGLLLYVQAQLLARYLRGDLDAYPPFLGK